MNLKSALTNILIASSVLQLWYMFIAYHFQSNNCVTESTQAPVTCTQECPKETGLSFKEETVNDLIEFILGIVDNSNNTRLKWDNPAVVNYVKNNLLIPANNLPYNLTNMDPSYDPSEGHTRTILELLHNKTNGFYIECGGHDGERFSNTLLLERMYNWNGILIEADPWNYKLMTQTNRKAWMSPGCLSDTKNMAQKSFFRNPDNLYVSGLIKREVFGSVSEFKVSCLPLYTYLLALNITEVDYFSLDVEGSDFEVIKTIPFDLVKIKTFSVEHAHFPGKMPALRTYLESKGYVYIKTIKTSIMSDDSIYIHSSVYDNSTRNYR